MVYLGELFIDIIFKRVYQMIDEIMTSSMLISSKSLVPKWRQ